MKKRCMFDKSVGYNGNMAENFDKYKSFIINCNNKNNITISLF